MSEEWLEYLKENNPELYAQAVASVDHAVRWRDRHIKRLESERDQLQTQLEAVRPFIRHLRHCKSRFNCGGSAMIEGKLVPNRFPCDCGFVEAGVDKL